MAECGKYVDGPGSVSYPCNVDKDHEGPCASGDLPRSIDRRQRWLADQATLRTQQRLVDSGLGQFQGAPQTAVQGLHADPSGAPPHPDASVDCPFCPERPKARELQTHMRWHATGQTAPEPEQPKVGQEWERRAPIDPEALREYMTGEPTKANREGDQQLPVPNDRPVMHEVLINLIQSRLDIGIKRYGTGLQPMNGRDVIRDLMEELIDASVYALQWEHERTEMADLAASVRGYLLAIEMGGLATIDPSILSAAIRLDEWLTPPSPEQG